MQDSVDFGSTTALSSVNAKGEYSKAVGNINLPYCEKLEQQDGSSIFAYDRPGNVLTAAEDDYETREAICDRW